MHGRELINSWKIDDTEFLVGRVAVPLFSTWSLVSSLIRLEEPSLPDRTCNQSYLLLVKIESVGKYSIGLVHVWHQCFVGHNKKEQMLPGIWIPRCAMVKDYWAWAKKGQVRTALWNRTSLPLDIGNLKLLGHYVWKLRMCKRCKFTDAGFIFSWYS